MSRPLVVSIPHSLGKEEAMRRLKTGFAQLKEKSGGTLAAAAREIACVNGLWAHGGPARPHPPRMQR
jgi:hypothetical protein